jgi:hypothetical protein
MPPAFHEYRDRTVAAVDRVMAEDIALYFMRNGVTDPERANITIHAVLRVGTGGNAVDTRSRNWAQRIAAGKAQMHVDRVAHPDLIVRKGDRIRATERPGRPFFEVLRPDDRAHGRLVLELGEI